MLVAPGDRVAAEDSLITLESDKASMEIPSPQAGVVSELRVSEGDRVSEGSEILLLEVQGAADVGEGREARPAPATQSEAEAAARPAGRRAARRPRRRPRPPARSGERLQRGRRRAGRGPRRLHRGVSRRRPRQARRARRALPGARRRLPPRRLHPVEDAPPRRRGDQRGRASSPPPASSSARRSSTSPALRARKDAVVRKLADGLAGLAQRRKLQVLTGSGRFESANRVRVEGAGTSTLVDFEHAIVAVGSRPVALPGLPRDPRILDSTERPRPRGRSGAAPRRRRRRDRPRAGDGLRGARLARERGRAAARAPRRRRRRPRAPAPAGASRPRYEAIWCGTRLLGLARRARRPARALRGAGSPRRGAPSTAPSSRSGGPGAAARSRPSASACASTSAASSRSTRDSAPTCRTSSRSAT